MAELKNDWLEDWNEDEIIEDEEVVFEGGSRKISGYGSFDVKITMAKVIKLPKKKVEFIALDFETKDGQTHYEEFMVRGSDGKPFFIGKQQHNKGKKVAHFGVSKIKSLLKVLGLYQDEKNVMASLYSNTELADVEVWDKGQKKVKEFTVFTDLIGKKVTICVSTKRENARTANDDSKYIKHCIDKTEEFKKANPKKKVKQTPDDEYVNVYRYFDNTEIKHFCQATDEHLFASEIASGEAVLYEKFMSANELGKVFDMRTLKVEELSEGEKEKWNLDNWGKQTSPEDDTEDDIIEEEESEDEDW